MAGLEFVSGLNLPASIKSKRRNSAKGSVLDGFWGWGKSQGLGLTVALGDKEDP